MEEKKEKRQVAQKTVLDAFFKWVEKTSALSTTNEALTKALNYTQNHKEYLETFLEDARLPISNNFCERSIRPVVVGRKNWLFADTPKGARVNAVLYTLVETARDNELDIYEYLKYLLEEMSSNDYLLHPEILDNYLLWSKNLSEKCRMKSNYKKHL